MNVFKCYIDSFSGLTREIWLIALIYLVNRCGEMVIPFMSLYITQQLGWTKSEAGIVLFCFGFGALFGSNIGGYLTDRIGNFKVMAISLFGTAIGFTCIIFFTSFYPLCTWLFITALFSSAFSPAAFGAISVFGNPENAARGYSLLRMAINLGVAIGPAIGGFVAYAYSYKWLFIIDGLTCALAGVVLFLVLSHINEPPKHLSKEAKTSDYSPYKDWRLILFLFFNLINMVAFFQILFSVPVYFREELLIDEFWIGIFFTVNGLLVFSFEMPLVYIIEKKKSFLLPMALGAIAIGLSYLSLYLFALPLIAIAIFSILIAFGEIINFPLIPTLAMKQADEKSQGKTMGLVSMMFAFAFTFAPIMGLPVVELVGFENYFLLACLLSVVSGICLLLMRQKIV